MTPEEQLLLRMDMMVGIRHLPDVWIRIYEKELAAEEKQELEKIEKQEKREDLIFNLCLGGFALFSLLTITLLPNPIGLVFIIPAILCVRHVKKIINRI